MAQVPPPGFARRSVCVVIQRYWRGYTGRLRGKLALELRNKRLRQVGFAPSRDSSAWPDPHRPRNVKPCQATQSIFFAITAPPL